MSITLDEFVTGEIKQLLEFASTWREKHKETPVKFPLTLDNSTRFLRQFYGFTSQDKEVQDEHSSNLPVAIENNVMGNERSDVA